LAGKHPIQNGNRAVIPIKTDRTWHIQYDAVGNRTAASNAAGSIAHNANNELLTYGDITYTYDLNGNLTQKRVGTAAVNYTYNVENRLIKVEDDLTNAVIAEYGYDPFGRRLWKAVGGVKTYFMYSDEGLIAEFDAQGNELRSYGWQPDSIWGTNPLWLRENGQYYFYQNDHLGTPQKLVAMNGAVVWSATYEAFGNAHVDVETVTNNLRFPGQYYDTETGLHYNFQRYYDPVTGRYVSADPIEFAGGEVNWYSYGKNNVLTWVDSFGLIPYSTIVQRYLRKEFTPLVKKRLDITTVPPECAQLYQAATLKFIADEFSDRRDRWGKEIFDEIQDFAILTGGLSYMIRGIFWPADRWVYEHINPQWKKGNLLQWAIARAHPAYNDIGWANIEPKTALELFGKDPATASLQDYRHVAYYILTPQGTVDIAARLVIEVAEELQPHFPDKCCQYNRKSVELIVNRLREGNYYWERAQESNYRYLMNQEQFEEWKKNPGNPEFPDIIKDWVKPLYPGVLDDDKYRFIEELTR